MRTHARSLWTVSLLVVVAVWAQSVFTRMSGAPEPRAPVQRDALTDDEAEQRADELVARWEADYAEQDLYTNTPIELAFSRAFSKQFTQARGSVELNFQTGQVHRLSARP
ncbi:MAG: hypothetical protein ACT4QD_19390 [Acidobacteriota bacterium]